MWHLICLLSQNPLYTLEVYAHDAGMFQQQTSSILVFFNVKDTNDHIPEFEQGEYQAAVYENVTVGTSIAAVTATDVDSGECRRTLVGVEMSWGCNYVADADSVRM